MTCRWIRGINFNTRLTLALQRWSFLQHWSELQTLIIFRLKYKSHNFFVFFFFAEGRAYRVLAFDDVCHDDVQARLQYMLGARLFRFKLCLNKDAVHSAFSQNAVHSAVHFAFHSAFLQFKLHSAVSRCIMCSIEKLELWSMGKPPRKPISFSSSKF